MKKNVLSSSLILLIILSFFPLLDLMRPGLPITHDGQDHVARIANFYQSLSDGVLVPRWGGNLNWGYGHPILMFLYPLPSYIASLLHFLGFSLIDSIKIVLAFFYIASGIAMYLWMREAYNEKAGVISALLYIFAPYRFIELYVRGDIGEHVAFVFPPLIAYFLLRFQKKQSILFFIGASVGIAGLILSHNAFAIMFLPPLFLYAIYLYKETKIKTFLFGSIGAFSIGFLLSAFFWIPAYFEGKYTLRDIVTAGEYSSRFVQLRDLLFGNWSYGGSGQFSVQIGIAQWMIIICTIFTLFFSGKLQTQKKLFVGSLFFLFFLILFLMTSSSMIIWEQITLLQKFQFPWRLLAIEVFLAAVMGGNIAFFVSRFSPKMRRVLILVLISILLLQNSFYWHANGFIQQPESFFTSIYPGTTDTGESAPIWSVRFMEKKPKEHTEVIEGNATIREVYRNSVNHMYQISATQNTRIRENTLYFPGWIVAVDGKKTAIEFQDLKNRGLITYWLPKGTHTVEIRFTETKLRLFSNILSVITIIGALFLLSFKNLWKRFLL